MSFMHNHTDMSNDVSTEMESDIENWSTSDLGIIVLMIAVIVVIQYNFFLNISWIQFIERNIIIIPAIIGLMLQFNFYFKRTTMKIGVATSSIVKRTTLNINVKTNVVVETFIAALTMIINLTVKRTYSITVAVINFVVKYPAIIFPVYAFFFSLDIVLYLNMSYSSRTVEAVFLSLIILITHVEFVGQFTFLVMSFFGKLSPISTFCVLLVIGESSLFLLLNLLIISGFSILILCFGILHNLNSHKTVYIVVTLSIVIFTHDLALSFVEIPHFVNLLLDGFCVAVSCVFFFQVIDCIVMRL